MHEQMLGTGHHEPDSASAAKHSSGARAKRMIPAKGEGPWARARQWVAQWRAPKGLQPKPLNKNKKNARPDQTKIWARAKRRKSLIEPVPKATA